VNLTLNLGGLTTYQGTTFSFDGNDVICYLNTAGDLIYIPGKPATLTVTSNTGDTCMGPSGSQIGILSEVGKVIPFNFYPTLTGGVMVTNYTYVTTTSSSNTPVVGLYPNAFNDAYGDPATDFSAIGRLTGTP